MAVTELYITRAVAGEMKKNKHFGVGVLKSLARFIDNDWGDTVGADKMTNDVNSVCGGRIFARYIIDGKTVYIITETNRKTMTILFAEEY